MKTISAGKKAYLKQMTNDEGIIGALAIDQRGALKKMIGKYKEATTEDVIKFKELVSQQLTPYASAILLDPEYGLPAAEVRDNDCGLLLAYEKTGYDATTPGRLPDVLNVWSVKRLKESGADACKFLLYYDVDEPDEINEQKRAYMERIGSECTAEDIPFFLEIVSYDAEITDTTSLDYAKVKPRKVIEAMREFSKERYQVDVLKVEVPVNMNFVEGYGQEIGYSQSEAAAYFKEQSEATDLPFIFLSAGVSAELFQETLRFAKQSGSSFNGVLCGRATWANGVESFVKEGEASAIDWLSDQGKRNIEELNAVLKETATSVYTNV
ncbi:MULTISPECIES: tagatose-bisphosphate aldolase [Enterococcus]|uniref:Tagatose 1,6-diphosphate aldolase n=1 Tax=Enterococcus malodoratus ATCC 43197 TaxID=1158601 RepID=R2NY06_9ENTE|nr:MULTISPECIES: tagatose-bisphosphate aldolase [Enterococcus]BBM16469.1 tagatose 1,6-diphosphate aldolase 1 [Enterococcus avium]EOH76887.1 tagatose 1,6-diphosphate aldolase 1 [Enterococcus malodoratus ATCC 43197]EOT63412.1 tagatose 1,6-diphosphate aldolase 1 [Enterococcus malodoratus ATCC 43197]SET30709.1 tagatose 1,6-diphosphate aldolase [Enterococcus malodoratus]SPW69474.1 tagatose 1,6-diphosphate aldolase [Enterococcus malodoratus]